MSKTSLCRIIRVVTGKSAARAVTGGPAAIGRSQPENGCSRDPPRNWLQTANWVAPVLRLESRAESRQGCLYSSATEARMVLIDR